MRLPWLLPWLFGAPLVTTAAALLPLSVDGPVVLSGGTGSAGLARVAIGVRYGRSADPEPRPPIANSEVTLIGPLTREDIAGPIQRAMDVLGACYRRALSTHPDLGGKIVVRFRIAADGSVSEAAIHSSTLGSATVEGCVVTVFQALHFPAPRGGGVVLVNYPLLFAPG